MKDILIIGAGAAGLLAGKILLEAGFRVTILEARDRTGGRIHTFKEKFSTNVEGGAEFIHGKQALTFSLLKEARAKKLLLKGNHYTVVNSVVEKGDLPDDDWQTFNKSLKKLKIDVTLQAFLDKNFSDDRFADLRNRVERFAEGFDIADTARVSAMALRDEWSNNDEARQYHIVDGYKTIMDYLETEVKKLGGIISLSSPVQEIRWKQNEVKAILADGRDFQAGRILITVPAGTMQHGDIKFSPPIPAYLHAFQELGFGGVIKFILEFREPVWEINDQGSLKNASFIFSDAEIPTWWTRLPDKTPVLTGWLGGPRAVYSTSDKEVLYERAVGSLQRILKCSRRDVERDLHHWHIADWVRDPFARGAYTYPTIKSRDASVFLRKGLAETVFFGGEALYEGHSSGTVEAAFVNGRSVAQQISSLDL